MQKTTNPPSSKPGLWPLFVVVAVLDSGMGSIFALLAEIRDQFDFTVVEVSLIGGAGFISAFISQMGLARFADRGHTRLLIRAGLVLSALAMMGLALADSLFLFVGCRFLFGVGQGAVVPAIRRLAILHNPGNAGDALGRLSAFHIFGFVMGPALGSVLTELIGLEANFLVFAAMIGACLPALNRIAISTKQVVATKRAIRTLLAKRGVVALLVAAVGYYGSFGIYEAIWAVFMSDLGASQLFIGFQLGLFALPMMFMAPIGGRWAGRVGPMTMSLCALLALVPMLSLYGVTQSILFLTLVLLLQGFTEAVISPAMQLGMSRLSGDDQASGQGLLNASGLVIAAGVALLSGAVYQTFGAFWLFFGWAMVMAVATLIAVLIGRRELELEAEHRGARKYKLG